MKMATTNIFCNYRQQNEQRTLSKGVVGVFAFKRKSEM
jgi:hypothetical protein